MQSLGLNSFPAIHFKMEIKLHVNIAVGKEKVLTGNLTATETCSVDTLTTSSKQEICNISRMKMAINKDLLGFKVF